MSVLQDQPWTRFFNPWCSAYDYSSESKNLLPILTFFFLNFTSKLNAKYSSVSITIHWVSLGCMIILKPQAGMVTAEQQPPALGLTYPPFVDDNRKKPEQRAGWARALALYDASPLWPTCRFGQEVKNSQRSSLLRDYPSTQVKSLGLDLKGLPQTPGQRFHMKSLPCG